MIKLTTYIYITSSNKLIFCINMLLPDRFLIITSAPKLSFVKFPKFSNVDNSGKGKDKHSS